jgi:hypothetical protein
MSRHHRHAHQTRDDWVCQILDARHPIQAHLIGIPYKVELEIAPTPSRVDHVWITVQVPPCGGVLLSVNTLSRLNLLGGFDPRVRLGILPSRWEEKPEPLLEPWDGLDYTTIEAQSPVDFQEWEHEALGEMLMGRARAALRIEAWGELYRRDTLGLHQIHSRRASCAVSADVIGRDGALRFYLPDGAAEMLLFKYCGQ